MTAIFFAAGAKKNDGGGSRISWLVVYYFADAEAALEFPFFDLAGFASHLAKGCCKTLVLNP